MEKAKRTQWRERAVLAAVVMAVALPRADGGPEIAPGSAGGAAEWEVLADSDGERQDWLFEKRLDAEGSVLWGDGIVLSEYTLAGGVTSEPFDLRLTVSRNDLEVRYEPLIFGAPSDLSEERMSYVLDGRWQFREGWSLLGAASAYDGFTDYRSLWISQYYEQLFGAVPGYVDPSPKGSSFQVGLEWEVVPVVSRLRLTGGYGKDTIAPAYDFLTTGLTRSRPDLYTKTLQLQAENVLLPRLVTQNTFQFTDTTNREKRWSVQTSWNWALADSWFLRTQAGFAVEQPNFDAFFVGGTLERELTGGWSIRLNARYYEDTGEIENSLGGFTSSAPPLESFELGAGLRWEGLRSALNLYVGYYQTEYEPLAADNAFLQNLYNDRRWGMVQLGYTYRF